MSDYDCRDPIMFAQRELELSGFADTDFGKAALEYIKQTWKISNYDLNIVRNLQKRINSLVDQVPLAPLVEEDFVDTEVLDYKNGSMVKGTRKQNYRVPFVYMQDGKYYDDRAIAFYNDHGDVWYAVDNTRSSKQEIQLPYFREEKRVKSE
jgi:hypothetical protein